MLLFVVQAIAVCCRWLIWRVKTKSANRFCVSERCQEALGKAPGKAQKEKPLRVPGGWRHLSGARQELKGQIRSAWCSRGERGFNQNLLAVALQQPPPHLFAAQKPRTSCSCQQHQWQPGNLYYFILD